MWLNLRIALDVYHAWKHALKARLEECYKDTVEYCVRDSVHFRTKHAHPCSHDPSFCNRHDALPIWCAGGLKCSLDTDLIRYEVGLNCQSTNRHRPNLNCTWPASQDSTRRDFICSNSGLQLLGSLHRRQVNNPLGVCLDSKDTTIKDGVSLNTKLFLLRFQFLYIGSKVFKLEPMLL